MAESDFKLVSLVRLPERLEPPLPPPSKERMAEALLQLRDDMEKAELVIDEANVVERRVGEEIARLKGLLASGRADPAVRRRLEYLQGYVREHLAKRDRAELVAHSLALDLKDRRRDWRIFFERGRSR